MLDIDKIEDTPHLLDILLQLEEVIDSLDIYVFRNWISGEVTDGPHIRRHNVEVSLLYPSSKMPDPRGAKRLEKYGVSVKYSKVQHAKKQPKNTPEDNGDGEVGDQQITEGKEKEVYSWMIKLVFPKRLLVQTEQNNLEAYEDDVDVDDVEDAKDSGFDGESGFMDPDGNSSLGQMPGMPPDPNQQGGM